MNSLKYQIDIYKLGFPAKVVKRFTLSFKTVMDAKAFAESILENEEGFALIELEYFA